MSGIGGHRQNWVPESADPTLPPGVLKIVYPPAPNLAERIVRVVRDVAATVALVLVSLLMLSAIQALSKIGNSLDRLRDPAPATTGCPFGEENCGG